MYICGRNLSILMFLQDLKFLKFGMFLLVSTVLILKSLNLKNLDSTYNPECPFFLDNFSPRLRYFNIFFKFILDQHIPKDFILFRITNKFVEVVRHPPKITAISGKMQELLPGWTFFLTMDLVLLSFFF